jgi:hypothetical protein
VTGMFSDRPKGVDYWNRRARWYRVWVEHNRYHEWIIETLINLVQPGWKVLDIGGGSGVLSVPLAARGCDVMMVEPSWAMREFMLGDAPERRELPIRVDDRRWEDIPLAECRGYDLIIGCNSLHVMEMGLWAALEKASAADPRHLAIVTEFCHPAFQDHIMRGRYRLSFLKRCRTGSSYAYHTLDEAYEHWSEMRDRRISGREKENIESLLAVEDNHYRLRGTANVHLWWWEKDCKEMGEKRCEGVLA